MNELIVSLSLISRFIIGMALAVFGLGSKDSTLFGVGLLLVWTVSFEAYIRNQEKP